MAGLRGELSVLLPHQAAPFIPPDAVLDNQGDDAVHVGRREGNRVVGFL